MRLLLQRVKRAEVAIAGETVAAIGTGLLVLAGFGREDGPDAPSGRAWRGMLKKLLELRIFPDDEGRMNRGLLESGGAVLLASQFTLLADCRGGRRPSFSAAAPPELARSHFDRLAADLAILLPPGRLARGVFAADMDVSLVNWGPATFLLDSRDLFGQAVDSP